MMQIVNQQYSLMGFVQHFFRPGVHQIRKYISLGDFTRRSHGTWRPKFLILDVCCQYPPPPQSGVEKSVTWQQQAKRCQTTKIWQQFPSVVGVQSLWILWSIARIFGEDSIYGRLMSNWFMSSMDVPDKMVRYFIKVSEESLSHSI